VLAEVRGNLPERAELLVEIKNTLDRVLHAAVRIFDPRAAH